MEQTKELTTVDLTGGQITPQNLVNIMGTFLKEWKPTNKIDAIRMIALLSTVNNATTVDNLKKLAYNYLDNKCSSCQNAVDPETGLEVVRTEMNKKVYKETAGLLKAKEALEKAKAKVKAEEEKAGVDYSNTIVYYKLK